MQGVIIKGIGGFYYIKAENSRIYECKARGIFRKDKIKPMIGDRVKIKEIDDEHGNIEDIYERTSELIRPPVANIDTLVIVAAAKNPEPDFFFIDKLLVMAEIRAIAPVICVNKTDLCAASEIRNAYCHCGYPIFEVSAEENIGIGELKEFLKGKNTAFAGLSGVGKSSIMNYLVESIVETGEISEKILRGKHTTRHVELFELSGGGYVLDTPGFSSFEPDIIKPQELCEYFPEMKEYIGSCRFKGCSHINEPECGVKNALEENKISQKRYESYTKLYDILKQFKSWENK